MRFVEIQVHTGLRETLTLPELTARLNFRNPAFTTVALKTALNNLQAPNGTHDLPHYWYRHQKVEEPDYRITA